MRNNCKICGFTCVTCYGYDDCPRHSDADCVYLAMKNKKRDFCVHCCGQHEPDDDEALVTFEDRHYRKPFRCLCCGKEICGAQFVFGRACAYCDTGRCQNGINNYEPGHGNSIQNLGRFADRFAGSTV